MMTLSAKLIPIRHAPRWLRKAVKGQERSGHKYVRRVPKPGGGYQYFYSNASTAHETKQGERVNLRSQGVFDVLRTDDKGVTLRDVKSGEVRHVKFDEVHAMMAKAYQNRIEQGAAHVVRKYLKDTEHLKDTNPSDPAKTTEAYQKRFASAGISSGHAERLISFLASRKGWQSEAKRAFLGIASDAAVGKRVTSRSRQIIRGAERLRDADGADRVTASHVGQAVALRIVKGDDISEKIADLQHTLRADNAAAKAAMGAIEAVGANAAAQRAMVDYAKTIVSSTAVHELRRMSQAYPGLRDIPELLEAQALEGRWTAILRAQGESEQARRDKRGIVGTETHVYVADADGNPTPQKARYRLMEATDIIASHDPHGNFAARKEYPEGVQERAYHRDKAEQEKVRNNAQKLRPAYVINTNPDAVNGPPVLTDDGIVLGGNSRAMSIQLAYASGDTAKGYRAHLAENAHAYGFSTADVDGMKAPVLVREVETDKDKANLGVLVRRYNESFTQSMDPRTDQVARGRMVSQGMIDNLAAGLDRRKADGDLAYPTLSAFLSSNDGAHFVRGLQSGHGDKAIIDRRNRSQYVGKDGKLNEDGKTFIERVLVGHLLPDPDLLSEMLPSQVSSIARSLPHIIKASGHGHDVRQELRSALEAHVYMRQHGLSSAKEYDQDQSLADFAGGAGFGSKPQLSDVGKGLLGVLIDRPGPVQMSDFFRDFSEQARNNSGGGTNLFGESMDTHAVMQSTLGMTSRGAQSSLFKSLVADGWPLDGWRECTNVQFMLLKGLSHKYIRRVPYTDGKGRQRYRYFYRVTGGHGIGHNDEIKVGSAFRIEDDGKVGHFHVTEDNGGMITVKHDESGQEHDLTKAELRAMLHKYHGQAIDDAVKRAEHTEAAARKHSRSAKQQARAEAESRRIKAQVGRDEERMDGAQKKAPNTKADATEPRIIPVSSVHDNQIFRLMRDSNDRHNVSRQAKATFDHRAKEYGAHLAGMSLQELADFQHQWDKKYTKLLPEWAAAKVEDRVIVDEAIRIERDRREKAEREQAELAAQKNAPATEATGSETLELHRIDKTNPRHKAWLTGLRQEHDRMLEGDDAAVLIRSGLGSAPDYLDWMRRYSEGSTVHPPRKGYSFSGEGKPRLRDAEELRRDDDDGAWNLATKIYVAQGNPDDKMTWEEAAAHDRARKDKEHAQYTELRDKKRTKAERDAHARREKKRTAEEERKHVNDLSGQDSVIISRRKRLIESGAHSGPLIELHRLERELEDLPIHSADYKELAQIITGVRFGVIDPDTRKPYPTLEGEYWRIKDRDAAVAKERAERERAAKKGAGKATRIKKSLIIVRDGRAYITQNTYAQNTHANARTQQRARVA